MCARLISVRDAAGRYMFVNATMAEFHGVPTAAFVGRTPDRIGVPDYALGAFSGSAAGEPVVVRDVPLVDATGRARRFDVVSRRLKAAGNAAGWLVLEVATEVAAAEHASPRPIQPRRAPSLPRPLRRIPTERRSTHGSISRCETATWP